MISDYFKEVELRIKNMEIVADKAMDFREFSAAEGMLRGRLLFVDGSILEFMEYLQEGNRLKYRFHLMNRGGDLIFRYDNAPHRNIATYPHHRHLPSAIAESAEMGLLDVLGDVEILILKGRELLRK